MVDGFVEELKRNRGEEIRDFDTRFEAKLVEVEALIGKLNPFLRAHYFLRKLDVGGAIESQIITGAMNKYEYEALRDSAISCLPRMSMLRGSIGSGSPADRGAGNGNPAPAHYGRRGQHQGRRRPHGAHETEGGNYMDDDGEESQDDTTGGDEAAGNGATGSDPDPSLPDELAHAIEENEVMMTQAKKHRADIDKAREFYKKPRGNKPEKSTSDRIARLKQRLPCAACGRLGHWKDDPEYPRNKGAHGANMVCSIYVMETGTQVTLMLLDTACAKTVAGRVWYDEMQKWCKAEYNIQMPT